MLYRIVFLFLIVVSFSCKEDNSSIDKTITFNKDIAPIIHKKCTTCHRENGGAPFQLINYLDLKKRTKMIDLVTQEGIMPPWPADYTYSNFIGENYLTKEEKSLIHQWINEGSPEGNENAPTKPIFPKNSHIGEPDLVVKMTDLYEVIGDNKDRFMISKAPYEITNDTFVKTIEFMPGNSNAVHHLNGHLIQYDSDKKENVFEGKSVINTDDYELDEAYEVLKMLHDDDSYPKMVPLVVNYLPGVITQQYPDGIGGFNFAKKGAIMANDLHYGPIPKNQIDDSYYNIFFTDQPPKRPTKEIQLGTLGISDIVPPLIILPDSVMTFRTKAQILEDVSVLTINPHMHLLGKKFWAYAIPPSGDTIPLIRIKKWDFRWQYFYTFKKMVKLPKGTTIYVEGVFDNTTNNPANPYNPPRVIAERNGSMRTTDEMFQFIITYLPYQKGDENISLEVD